MSDILIELHAVRERPARPGTADGDVNVFNLDYLIAELVLEKAIEEIERFRMLAGAVSDGPSFAELTKDLPRRSTEDNSR